MKRYFLLLLVVYLVSVTNVHAQIIETLAGNGFNTHSGDGGPATAATLANPFGVVVDSRGNIFVAEYSKYVRRIDRATGIITTIAGGGVMPTVPTSITLGDGGPATAAYLDVITDLAIDAFDNLYIADHTYGRIRKVDASGIITTIAGGSLSTADNIPATAAKLTTLNGITIDPAGTIYLGNGTTLHKVTTSGIISKLAGTGVMGFSGDGGPATAANLYGAYDVALDKAGNIYFTDENTNCVRKITPAGIISTIAGTGTTATGYAGDGGPATAAEFDVPWGIALDKGDNIYICDTKNGRVRMINYKTDIIKTVVGSGAVGHAGDGGLAIYAGYAGPNLTIDCGGNLFLTGSYSRLRKVTYMHDPYFTGVDDTLDAMCSNAGPVLIDTFLFVNDIDMFLPIDWTVEVAPKHGTISGAPYSTTTTGSAIPPAGIYYTPTRGYSGIDSFTIMAGSCNQVADMRKLYVQIKPIPVIATVTGSDTVCTGSTIVLANATPGGVWTMKNGLAAIAGGSVTGIAAGSDSVGYVVTDVAVGCSDTAWHAVKVKVCAVGVNDPKYTQSTALRVYPNPVHGEVHIDGIQGSATYRVLNMVGGASISGELAAGNNSVTVAALSNGMYMLEVTDAAGVRHTSRIVK